MRIGAKAFRTIWPGSDAASVQIIDQTRLPHEFEIISIKTASEAAHAIKNMQVRGAPLIGVTAAYGLALAMRAGPSDANLDTACAVLAAARPTAVNLQWALAAMRRHSWPCLQPNAAGPASPMPARSPNKTSPFVKRSANMGSRSFAPLAPASKAAESIS